MGKLILRIGFAGIILAWLYILIDIKSFWMMYIGINPEFFTGILLSAFWTALLYPSAYTLYRLVWKNKK